MARKLSESFRHAKLTKKSSKSTLHNTSINKVKREQEIERVAHMSDNKINYSDIPELDFDQLGKPVIGKFYRPIKQAISIRLDGDLLDWFKSQPEKYQSLINKACRLYMQYIRTHKTTHTQ